MRVELLSLLAAGAAGMGIYKVHENQGNLETQIMMTQQFVYLVALAVWPIIWELSIGFKNTKNIVFYGAFLWPIIYFLWEIFHPNPSGSTTLNKNNRRIDAAAVISIGFALGSLFNITKQGDYWKDIKSVPMLILAILLLVFFVIPTPTLEPGSVAEVTVNSVQNVCLLYSIGILVTGIIVHLSGLPKCIISP